MKKKLLKNRKGLSLVEVLAVITILGILAAVATVSVNVLTKDSAENDKHMKAEILYELVSKYAVENNGVIPTIPANSDYISDPALLDMNTLIIHKKDREKYQGNYYIYGTDNKIYYEYPPEYIKEKYNAYLSDTGVKALTGKDVINTSLLKSKGYLLHDTNSKYILTSDGTVLQTTHD